MDTPEDVVHKFAVSQTRTDSLDLLALLAAARGGATGSELVAELGSTREPVYRRLQEFVELGFVDDRNGNGFWTTRAGQRASTAYRESADRVGDETLAYLARSPKRRRLIRALGKTPATKSALAEDADLPPRPTIHRVLEGFDERGWLHRADSGKFMVTEQATGYLQEYERLVGAIEQAIEKSQCIQTLAYWANPPLNILSGAELVIETEENPHAMLDATVEAAGLRDGGLRHLRTVVPVFDPVMYDVFNQYIDSETTFEIVFDQKTYRQLTEITRLPYLARSVIAPNTSVRIHPDPLYTGLGIYNDQTVMLGGSSRHDDDAAVISNNEPLLQWANERFEIIWEESQPPSERLREWLNQAAPSPIEWSELLAQRETG